MTSQSSSSGGKKAPPDTVSPTHQRVRRWLEWVVLVTTALINAVTAVDLLVDILVSIGPL